MRQLGALGGGKKTITATPRQLESLIRISEALAKIRLSKEVLASDVNEAIRLMHVATQKAAIDPKTGKINMDAITTGFDDDDENGNDSMKSSSNHQNIDDTIINSSQIEGQDEEYP